MSKILTVEERLKILTLLKNTIDREHACRVGYAIDEITKTQEEHNIEKIAAEMIEDNKYIRVRRIDGTDYFISKNPEYRLNKSIVAANKWLPMLTAGMVLASFITIAISIYKSTPPVYQNILQPQPLPHSYTDTQCRQRLYLPPQKRDSSKIFSIPGK